jgi:crotonobetainyl-CoA:carnitine CoA-transferase CaiB-like acyl-CoA transferase
LTDAPAAAAPLAGLRILDLIRGAEGAFAGRLLASLGAEVVKVEPPAGNALRGDAPYLGDVEGAERSLRWHHYAAGMRSVVLDLDGDDGDRESFVGLAAEADAVLENMAPGRLDELGIGHDLLRERNPGLVMTSITPFGQNGPRRDWLGGDIVGYATGGMMSLTGESNEAPVRLGGGQAHQLAGLYAAMGTLCALTARVADGRGDHVDVSIQEAVASSIADAGVTYFQLNDGLNPGRVGTEHPIVVPVVASPAKDGHLLIDCAEGHQFRSLVEWAREHGAYVEPLEDPGLDVAMNRLPMRDLINTLLATVTEGFEKAAMYEPLQKRSIPVAPVSSMADIEHNAQLAARDFWGGAVLEDGGDPVTVARSPFTFERNELADPARGPRLGEHQDEPFARPWDAAPPAHARRHGRTWGERPRALDGVRILDFSWALAGPWTGRMLAHEGAEVIRVESPRRLDVLRQMAPDPERAGAFINANSGKLGLAIELGDPEGAEIARRLAAEADIVVDNFRPGVMERLGLDHESLAKVNPEIITCSLPAQGETGPHREFVAYGPVLHALAGFTFLTGHPDGPPSAICSGFVDQLAAGHAAVAILSALRHRDRTGEGQHVSLSQFEAAIGMLDSVALEYFANGTVETRRGNRDRNAAPQGCYGCAGNDQWVAVTVSDDEQWPRLARLIGRDDLAADAGLADAAGRGARHDEIDAAIAAWSGARDAEAAMEELQAARVPAGKVQRVGDLLEHDPHLRARGFYRLTDHPVIGEIFVDGPSIRLRRLEGDLGGRPGPLLGQDTRAILEEIIGIDAADVERLIEAGVVAGIDDAALERRLGTSAPSLIGQRD